ncbi:hypothetical protein FC61_GL001667 [Levilactobacillus brevis ATCC 14869 = DSM 20054]|uniref:Uncharacterized protein n=1 Tax=Levilactobacillus brevis ATCC 14869 = DSM 20054 TaxID=649758 RepID=U2PJY8_LEVBR|nr:hypothetical protein HMPREF0495_00920 [Levilactobacillus brevis ATCC 14869 = DSM 20054]KIO98642.1 hypothetical protein QP38_1331 [Levilactobacillus brevis]KRK20057.1 hypothetical protein FC61_GL001667 [Levilactobacillus brevis ATCC 14869 = DSM 20054]
MITIHFPQFNWEIGFIPNNKLIVIAQKSAIRAIDLINSIDFGHYANLIIG